MTPAILAAQPITRSADHQYTYEGKTYPGVTTILRVLDKSDGLVPWAAKETATGALRLWQAGVLETLVSTVGEQGAIKAMTDRSTWQRDEAAQLGGEVHRLAEVGPEHPEWVTASVTAKSRALIYQEWWEASGWTRPLREVMGVNPSVGYGGTADLLARDTDGRLVLADIKTGKGVYRESILQLAAYGAFTCVQVADGDGWMVRVPPLFDRYVILHVTLDGVREIELSVGEDEHMAFLDCADLYRWTQKVKGRL